MSVLDRFRTDESLRGEVNELRSGLRQEQNENLWLTERLAELELALEDVDWVKVTGGSDRQFSREAINKIARLARVSYLKNPLIRRGVDVQSFYVWGQGVTVKAEDEDVNDVVQRLMTDRKNRRVLFGHQARILREVEQQIEGNLFFALFTDRVTGSVHVRAIPSHEIVGVRTNPEDRDDVWYYERHQLVGSEMRKRLYPAMYFSPRPLPSSIDGIPIEWNAPVYHIRTGGLLDMDFGVPEVYPALDWAKAHKEFLEDWATLVRSLSRFAWRLTTKGRNVPAAKTKLSTTRGTSRDEDNPAPVTGATFIGDPNTQLTPIPKTGATTSVDDNKAFRLQVAAALGLPDTFFGDPDQGNLATARTLDRPTELKFTTRQELWASVYEDITTYAIAQSIRAPGGVLSGTVETEDQVLVTLRNGADPNVGVVFPSILERDVPEIVKAAVSAATLDGKTPAGTVPHEALARHLMETLGFENVDVLIDELDTEADPGMSDVVEALREVKEAARELSSSL